jgi:uncharacterized repeat protein (TIGR01451 family)
VFTRAIQRKRPRRPAFALLAIAATAALLSSSVALALVVDSGSHSVIVPDSTESAFADPPLENAIVEYIGSSADNQSSGTGIFDPFVRLQGSPTEQGFNTNGAVEDQSKAGKWTHAIKAGAIPVVDCDGDPATDGDCWELFVDINESNTAKYLSLNEVEIWFTDDPNLVGHPFTTTATTFQVYDFSGAILIHDVNQGSGRGDLRYLVELDNIDAWDADTYFVLYSQWGTSVGTAPDGKTWGSEGGFEEWKVRKTANLSIVKTANPVGPVNAGSNIGFDITISNTGVADAVNVVLTDQLPTGGGLNWSLVAPVTGCTLSATDLLSCTFATMAPGASITIRLTSPTTAADCAQINNTASYTSTNAGSGSDPASVVVQCGAIQITKTAKHADDSGDTSANLVATFDVTDAAGNVFEVTTGADGVGCVGGLAVGMTQSIVESGVPDGYDAPTIANVNVASGACSTAGVTNVNVENTPLTDVSITIDSQHDGATSTLIECWGPGSDPATDEPDYFTTVSDGSLDIDDLSPTDPAITLNCQITVDP